MENHIDYEVFPQHADTLFLLPGEKMILHKRQHVFAVIIPIIIASILGTVALLFLASSLFFFYHARFIIILASGCVITTILFLITKTIIDWYFHMYMVTNRRILEFQYRPFFSQDINDVLLDQVRCTEIDVQIHGYVHGLIDVGDIIITFDRPTHQQEFVLHDIKSPRKISTMLGELLNTPKDTMISYPTWYTNPTSETKEYIFSEQLYPRKPFATV